MVYLISGKAGAGKSEYAKRFAEELKAEEQKVMIIDGDEFRDERGNDDYSDEGRIKNLMDAAEFAAEYEAKGVIVLMAFVSPRREWRNAMRKFWQESMVVYIPGGTLWEGTTYERPEYINGELR